MLKRYAVGEWSHYDAVLVKTKFENGGKRSILWLGNFELMKKVTAVSIILFPSFSVMDPGRAMPRVRHLAFHGLGQGGSITLCWR